MCLGGFGWQVVKKIREILDDTITDFVLNHREVYCNKPDTDFTRNRVFTPQTIISTLFQFESRNTESELINIFDSSYHVGNINAALLMQRAKIKNGAFQYLFHSFTDNVLNSGLIKTETPYGYPGDVFLADGSGVNIARNEKDPSTFVAQKGKKGYNQFHLNALYDFRSHAFVDSLVQGIHKKEERQALVMMISRMDPDKIALIIADRGYEGYNVFATCIEHNKHFIIRLKDLYSNGILSSHVHNLPDGEFDLYISTILTRKRSLKTDRTKDIYTVISPNTTFDFFDENGEYPICFRIVRFKLPNGEYETVATNLDRVQYDADTIKELYNERWNCETAFAKLKYTLGLVNFHSRKMKYIEQELFVKLTLFNFISFVMDAVRQEQEELYGDFYSSSQDEIQDDRIEIDNDEEKVYRVDLSFSQAMTTCRRLLKKDWLQKLEDVIKTIRAHIYKIKLNRTFARNVKPQSWKPFNHRPS